MRQQSGSRAEAREGQGGSKRMKQGNEQIQRAGLSQASPLLMPPPRPHWSPAPLPPPPPPCCALPPGLPRLRPSPARAWRCCRPLHQPGAARPVSPQPPRPPPAGPSCTALGRPQPHPLPHSSPAPPLLSLPQQPQQQPAFGHPAAAGWACPLAVPLPPLPPQLQGRHCRPLLLPRAPPPAGPGARPCAPRWAGTARRAWL